MAACSAMAARSADSEIKPGSSGGRVLLLFSVAMLDGLRAEAQGSAVMVRAFHVTEVDPGVRGRASLK